MTGYAQAALIWTSVHRDHRRFGTSTPIGRIEAQALDPEWPLHAVVPAAEHDRLRAASEALARVEALHATTYYDAMGRVTSDRTQARWSWCQVCESAGAEGCATRRALEGTEPDPGPAEVTP